MWVVVLFALTSMIALGFVVANVGALFRLRYIFWMMIIVVAMKGSEALRDTSITASEEGRFTPASPES